MCFSPIWSDGVIDGDRDFFMVSPSLFPDADYHQVDYDNLNCRYYVFFPSVEIGIYPYQLSVRLKDEPEPSYDDCEQGGLTIEATHSGIYNSDVAFRPSWPEGNVDDSEGKGDM